MKRELGFGYCGLVCALCNENEHCVGCRKGGCKDKDSCKCYQCCTEKGYRYCSECVEFPCQDSILHKERIAQFAQLIPRYGEERFLTILEANEQKGMQYHRDGLVGDYDGYETVEALQQACFQTPDVYETCPTYENDHYRLRFVNMSDVKDLVKVYSDKQAVPFFNSDNCGEDDFYYTTEKRMEQAITYWLWEYKQKGFVRWSILDKSNQQVIGTIEVFHRDAKDYFTNCAILRLDLRSDYEEEEQIKAIVSLLIPSLYESFHCDKIATKIISSATKRKQAFESIGFNGNDEVLIGHDGSLYDSYYVKQNRKATVIK